MLRGVRRTLGFTLIGFVITACGGSSGGGAVAVDVPDLSTSELSPDASPPDASLPDASPRVDLVADTAPDLAQGGPEDATAEDVPPDVPPPQPFTIEALTEARINSTGDVNVRGVSADIDWGEGPFERVVLTADLSSTCYPFEGWQTNPPPEGQNWPADCDAFDRNFELSLDEPEDEGDAPGLELIRAITPFGGPLTVEADITDIANGLPGAHRLAVHISTWSDGAGQVSGSAGGWTVSARVVVTPGSAPRHVLAVVPLYRGSHGAMEAPRELPFSVPEGTTEGRIEYRVTGHGGGARTEHCIGPADEFCWRTHQLSLDGVVLAEETPWRDDCDTLCTVSHYGPESAGFDYCLENPCGNMGSVRAPRANWCPGSVTPPFVYEWEALRDPGEHTFAYEILDVGSGGSWSVSATFFAFSE